MDKGIRQQKNISNKMLAMCAAPVDGRGCYARIIVSPKNMELELALNNIEQAKIHQGADLQKNVCISFASH